jgi:phenylalanyl-tRNA synthetase alpha chain
LGKKSFIQLSFKELKSLDPEKKVLAAKKLNLLRNQLNNIFRDFQENINFNSAVDIIDTSLPVQDSVSGVHPISECTNKILKYFENLNFKTFYGNEIETDFYNFEALNFPKNHPARQMHDTFYVDTQSKDGYLLRTHTSNTQIHSMLEHSAPIYMLSPGRVYRCDSDTTHLPMFTQVEGLAVDVDISFADLKGILIDFLEFFFNKKMDVRFRPSYFPFTEPSAEVDIKFDSDWLEVLGCGMVHPNVLKNCNIDHNKFQGYAFGMGVERLAMLYYGVKDIRDFYSSNLEFLEQI